MLLYVHVIGASMGWKGNVPAWLISPKHPASVVIDYAMYSLTISSPNIDNVAMSLYDIMYNAVIMFLY